MSQLFDDAPQDTTTGATDGGADKAATTTGGQEENTLLGGEEKPAEAKPDQGGEDPEGGDPKAATKGAEETTAPPTYTDFAVPEGMQVNETLMAEFKAQAAEMGLPQEAAQKLVDLQVKNTQAQVDAFHRQRAEWRSEFPAGAADPVVKDAAYVLRRFDTDGPRARELAETGQGDNPKVIRFLAAIRKEFREDAVYTGENARQDSRPLRERLWPDETMPR